MFHPVYKTSGNLKQKGKIVFWDRESELMNTDHFREVIWKPALEKAEVEYRPPI